MPYRQTTHAELLQALQDTWEGSPFWTGAQGTRYLNHSLRTWNLLTGMWKRKILVSTPSPVSPYISLPGSITYGMEVVWGPTGKALQLTSIWDLDQGKPRWEEQTTVSAGGVPTSPQLWAPNGLSELAIWPADASGGQPLMVDGVASTPILVLPTDYVDMGAQDATVIAKYALHIASFTRGAAALQATAPYFLEFVLAARDQNSRLTYSAFYRRFLGLDHRRSWRPAVDPAASAGGSAAAPAAGKEQG